MEGCPRCGSRDVRRSRRRGLERALSWLAVYPFRCLRCDHRFLRFATRHLRVTDR